MEYKKLNIIIGWFTWLIASVVFVSTIEPTASFWDCGEFIATAYKMEVGHPPGAPFFMLIARLFSAFVPAESAAMMVNVQSALCSSFTILFLFWSITALGRRLALSNGGQLTQGNILAIMGSGLVGALAYTFSDSFWFSAVEGEVYAMSSLFTAIVFWAILKWEQVADTDKYANRWLILIAYLMGLSIGVHLLNLLAVPAIVFVYYFKKYEVTQKGIIWASVISLLILGGIQAGIIPWTVKLASYFELFFVNSMGMPFNTGIYMFLFILVAGLVYGVYWSQQNKKVLINTILNCVVVILIGYSTFGVILIRSAANPPMDENNPENAFTLLSYLNREQYGDRPLVKGHYFNSPLDNQKPYEDGKPVYFQDKENGVYIISDDKKSSVPNYAEEFTGIFPRMYSSEGRHKRAYKSWSDFKGRAKSYRTVTGETKTIKKPTFGENVQFFIQYQIKWMYLRYFMWNFAGRQNDIQGHGNDQNGNWISGISAIDSAMLGNQDKLTEEQLSNPARNSFYLLPLILGIIGMFFHFMKKWEDGLVVGLLFLLTGIAIVVYLNQYPYQPRERDYAYAGSFYAFAFWIGIGVYGLYDIMSKRAPQLVSAGLITVICLVAVPGIMASEGWDDHDRSDTYTARDFAKDYLDSCQPNAILFTNGYNDTFPLWYVQEVEEYRTDVRVVNLSLLNTDWYIDQMRRKAYDSEPVPFGLEPKQYRQGTRDYVPVVDMNKKGVHIDVKEMMDFIADGKNQREMGGGKRMNYFPTNKFSLKVPKSKVIANGTVPKGMEDQVVDEIKWTVKKNYILKNDMMILDLLANNKWERPVYFAITTGDDAYIGLKKYFQLEGLAYHLVPYECETTDGQTGRVHTEIMYDNLVNKFSWGGIKEKPIYLNENNRRMCMNLRNNFARLADAFIAEGNNTKAVEVLDKCMEELPVAHVPINFFMLPVTEAYYKAGAPEKGNELVRILAKMYDENLEYYFSLDSERTQSKSMEKNIQQAISVLYRLNILVNRTYKQDDLGPEIQATFDKWQESLSSNGIGQPR